MRDYRIGLLVNSMMSGGAEQVILNLASGLANLGITVDLVLLERRGEHLSKLPDNVNLVAIDARSPVTGLIGMLRYILTSRPDALLSALTKSNILALMSKLVFRKTLRVALRFDSFASSTRYSEVSGLTAVKSAVGLWVLKSLLPLADSLIGVSNGVANDLRHLTPRLSDRITVINNPLVSSDHIVRAEADVDHPWFNDEEIQVVLTVGRLVPVKDHRTLLEAFAIVRESRPSARLVLMGDGPEKNSLVTLAERLNVGRYLSIIRYHPNPFAYMSKSSVVVLSSLYEGLSNVLVESLASGAPVVSTDCESGPREVLEGGEFGALVPVGDAKAMARAILHVLDNPVSSDRIDAARSAMFERFSFERSIDEHLKLLFPTESLNVRGRRE